MQSEENISETAKGIYYSNGNYDICHPEKPGGVDDKHAYIVGSGLASPCRMLPCT